ncbi:MAG: hypothetical protein AAGA68_22095 [Pseudomonadota bacterium]
MKATHWLALVASASMCSSVALAQDSFDSDNDGFDDNSDNCTLVANPDQRDTNGDGFGNVCDADLNNNDLVDRPDFVILRQSIGDQEKDLDADLNGDDRVGREDFFILRDSFGQKPGPTGAHPDIPACNCYFSGDCVGNDQFCDWGPAGFTVEDICWWRDPKPTQAGNGCSTEYEGPWGPICDGFCTNSNFGSSVGHEDPAMLTEAVELWAGAMLKPARGGGGPVDDALATQARAVGFLSEYSSEIVGRNTADLLGLASSTKFYDYFCHFEHHPNEAGEVVNLKGDSCRLSAARIAIDALTTEMRSPGQGAPMIQQIADVCPEWQTMYAPRCPSGPQALACVQETVEALARFLTTPRAPVQRSILDYL